MYRRGVFYKLDTMAGEAIGFDPFPATQPGGEIRSPNKIQVLKMGMDFHA